MEQRVEALMGRGLQDRRGEGMHEGAGVRTREVSGLHSRGGVLPVRAGHLQGHTLKQWKQLEQMKWWWSGGGVYGHQNPNACSSIGSWSVPSIMAVAELVGSCRTETTDWYL